MQNPGFMIKNTKHIFLVRFLDDCADKPCALNATCSDLVNDFRCDCPPGFGGKRCHEKINLCAENPCVNGLCVDTLHQQRCVCEPGWTGHLCDINIDNCSNHPCLNGATCKDQVFLHFFFILPYLFLISSIPYDHIRKNYHQNFRVRPQYLHLIFNFF